MSSETALLNNEEDISHQQTTDNDSAQSTKKWITRTFGPMNPGSLRGSVFTLMSSALGSGVFALPNSLFYKCGFIIGIMVILITSTITLVSLKILMKSSIKANVFNYPDLAKYCFGNFGGKTIQWALIIYVFGLMCGYEIIISNFFIQLIQNDFGILSDNLDCSNFRCITRDIQIIIVTILVIPLSLKRDFYSLRHVTIFGVISIIYAIIVVFSESFNTDVKSSFSYAHFDWNLFTGYTSSLFAFTCYSVVFPIRKELENPNSKRVTKIFNRAVITETILYFILSISGYISIYQLNSGEVKDLIIQQSSSIPMIISRIAMILFLFVAIPINLNPGRTEVINLINGNTEATFNTKIHFSITMLFLIGPCAISIFFPNIQSVFSFLGGACSTLLGITFPFLMFVKLNKKKWNSFSNLIVIILAIFLTIVGYVAAFLSLLNAFI